MTPCRRISCYNDLVDAFVACKAELNLSDAVIDDGAGLARGHWSKIVARERRMDPSIQEALLMFFGVDLVMVVNPARRAEMQQYYEGRRYRYIRTKHKPRNRTVIRVMQQLGRQSHAKMQADGRQALHQAKAAKARQARLSPKQRRDLARKAAAVRWSKSR